jgi:hypothetical protein
MWEQAGSFGKYAFRPGRGKQIAHNQAKVLLVAGNGLSQQIIGGLHPQLVPGRACPFVQHWLFVSRDPLPVDLESIVTMIRMEAMCTGQEPGDRALARARGAPHPKDMGQLLLQLGSLQSVGVDL